MYSYLLVNFSDIILNVIIDIKRVKNRTM